VVEKGGVVHHLLNVSKNNDGLHCRNSKEVSVCTTKLPPSQNFPTSVNTYIVCPKSNASDFFAQPRTARKGKWELRQVEGEPTYTVGPSSVESVPL